MLYGSIDVMFVCVCVSDLMNFEALQLSCLKPSIKIHLRQEAFHSPKQQQQQKNVYHAPEMSFHMCFNQYPFSPLYRLITDQT